MIWKRLKDYECPRCKMQLYDNTFTEEHICKKCGFRISYERFNDIVNDIYKPRPSDAYGRSRSNFDDFASGASDPVDEHDEFWLNPKSQE